MYDQNASTLLARFVADITYEGLSEAARDATKRSIMDTIGVTTAAATCGIGHEKLARLVERGAGTPESTVIGFGIKVPTWMAALANGAMARAVNFDDSHDQGSTHSSSVVVPAALAVAERLGRVDGKSFITAVAVGNEIVCRLGKSLASRPGGVPHDRWFMTSVLGIFGGVAACCRLLRLDAEQTRNAFGIALFETSGTLEAFSPTGQSAMMRGMVTGFTAKSAVLAASMAEVGITGVPESFDGKFGLFKVFFDGSHDRDALLGELNARWALTEIALKGWPAMRYTNSYIDAVGRIVREHDIAASDIVGIRVYVAGYVATRFEPLEKQRRPRNYNHAGHALPYLVAAMAVRRSLTMEHLLTGLDDADVLAMAQRVMPVDDAEFGGDNRIGPAKVVVITADGTEHAKSLDYAYGDPRDAMAWDDIAAKFRECLRYRRAPLGDVQTERLIADLRSLERVGDVGALAGELA
ncbi:MAG: MmgE/PrpD family protein [Rhodobacteraceae bacterium]|nr:MmgE/PrpD family protein [Paracoccaceae bacterium]